MVAVVFVISCQAMCDEAICCCFVKRYGWFCGRGLGCFGELDLLVVLLDAGDFGEDGVGAGVGAVELEGGWEVVNINNGWLMGEECWDEQKRRDSMADAVKTWSFALSRSGRREEMSGRVEDRSGVRASSRSSM